MFTLVALAGTRPAPQRNSVNSRSFWQCHYYKINNRP